MILRPRVIYSNPDDNKKNSIIRYIGNRVTRENQNFMCAITGGTGKGKSWAALSIAEIYSEMYKIDFNVNKHVIHSYKEILQLLNAKNVNEILKPCSIIIFEELQVSANSRDWQGQSNKGLNRLVSTFRNKRLIVLFTTPILRFIDNQTRELFHGEFEVINHDKNLKTSLIRPRFLTPKPFVNDFYRARMIIQYADREKEKHQVKYLSTWTLPKASDYIIDAYEAKKKAFNDKLNADELKKIELQEKQALGRNKSDDLVKVKDLYDKYGEDYLKISQEMPHISPLSLEKLVLLIKRTIKEMKKSKP